MRFARAGIVSVLAASCSPHAEPNVARQATAVAPVVAGAPVSPIADGGVPAGPLALDASVRDSRTGLVIHYPKSWHIDRDSSFFAIESFPAKERPPQLLVPVGGAYIVISMQRVHSIEEWLEADGLTKDNGYRFEEAQLQTQRGTVPAGRITLDHDRVIPEGHMLIHGFFVGDRMYKVFLFYRGAPYEAQYEEIYYDLVRALQFPQ